MSQNSINRFIIIYPNSYKPGPLFSGIPGSDRSGCCPGICGLGENGDAGGCNGLSGDGCCGCPGNSDASPCCWVCWNCVPFVASSNGVASPGISGFCPNVCVFCSGAWGIWGSPTCVKGVCDKPGIVSFTSDSFGFGAPVNKKNEITRIWLVRRTHLRLNESLCRTYLCFISILLYSVSLEVRAQVVGAFLRSCMRILRDLCAVHKPVCSHHQRPAIMEVVPFPTRLTKSTCFVISDF